MKAPGAWLWALLLVPVGACSPRASTPSAAKSGLSSSCLPGERGYLRAGLRGALDRDLDWRGAQLQCEGGARPAGHGLRVSFAGISNAAGQRLRIVFGIAAQPGAPTASHLPTNVTVIVEGENRLYATQGEDKCQVESMAQEALPRAIDPGTAPGARDYRIAARGYCVDPATTLDGSTRLYINRFDFAGIARFEDNDLHAPTPTPTPTPAPAPAPAPASAAAATAVAAN